MTVTRIVGELLEGGLVEEGESSATVKSAGRPGTGLHLRASGGYVIGVTINAYEQSVVVANICGEVIDRRHVPLTTPSDGNRSIIELAAAAKHLIKERKISRQRVLGVGVTVAGTVDQNSGTILGAPSVGWKLTDVTGPLMRILRAPVTVDTIANALLRAEIETGSYKGAQNVLLFLNGITIGGSAYLNGHLAVGANQRAGRIGHLPIEANGRTCSCGQQGCLNTVASGWAVIANMGQVPDKRLLPQESEVNREQLDTALQLERDGNIRAAGHFLAAGRIFGEAIRPIVSMFDPEKVILAGPVGKSSSFLEGARQGIDPLVTKTLSVSVAETHRAAISIALSDLVFSSRLAIDKVLQPQLLKFG